VGSIADELATIPYFSRVPARDVRASAPLWEQVALGAGEILWHQNAPVDALAILLFGELVAELDGVAVGRVLPGELLGEASAFFAGTARSATLRARVASQVAALSVPSLHTLRWQRSAVYDALLDQALLTLVRRVAATNVRIAQAATGRVAAPARTEPSALVRLWKTLRPGGPSGPCPPIEPLLRRQPGLAEVDGETLAAIAQAFVAEPLQEGQIVFLEGEAGSAAWLVAEGQVDVLRHVRGDRAELLASLGAASLFGINTLVERGARTASCVAARPGWLYRIDAEGHARLRGGNRQAWRESLLGVLATQIRNANAGLQKVSGGPKAPPRTRPATADGFQDLLRASGWLEGVPDTDLERLEVVVTEDARRNPKNRRG
jgi:CRP-like cAMP-binding protein